MTSWASRPPLRAPATVAVVFATGAATSPMSSITSSTSLNAALSFAAPGIVLGKLPICC